MASPKVASIAGRSATDEKKGKQYLRISPLHRQVLVANYKRAKRAARSAYRASAQTTEMTVTLGASMTPKVTDTPEVCEKPFLHVRFTVLSQRKLQVSSKESSEDAGQSNPETTVEAPRQYRRARDTSATGSDIGPMPEFPEELARQWGWTDDSWKHMGLHRRTKNGWVRMREPVSDFERKFLGLPLLPRDVLEVRLEERRLEDLEILMKRHGFKPQGPCERCREDGKPVRTLNTNSCFVWS